MRVAVTLGLALALLTTACGDDKVTSAAGITDGWKSDGLEVGAFADANGAEFGGGKCRAGTVASLDTTVCEFADAGAAKKAERAAEKSIGETTGISMAAGRMLLVVADRKKADPEGRKMNQIAAAFRKRAQ
jgi:hypothetical protein